MLFGRAAGEVVNPQPGSGAGGRDLVSRIRTSSARQQCSRVRKSWHSRDSAASPRCSRSTNHALFRWGDWGTGDRGAPLGRQNSARPEGFAADRRSGTGVGPFFAKLVKPAAAMIGSTCGKINKMITHTPYSISRALDASWTGLC